MRHIPRDLQRTTWLFLWAALGAALASCTRVYIDPELPRDTKLPAVTPRDLEQANRDRPVNLVVRCESSPDPAVPIPCDQLEGRVFSILLRSAVFSDITAAENVDRLEVSFDTHTTVVPFSRTDWSHALLILSSAGILGFTNTVEHVLHATFTPAGGSAVRREYRQRIYVTYGLVPVNGRAPQPAIYCGLAAQIVECRDEAVEKLLSNLLRDLRPDGMPGGGEHAAPPIPAAEER